MHTGHPVTLADIHLGSTLGLGDVQVLLLGNNDSNCNRQEANNLGDVPQTALSL